MKTNLEPLRCCGRIMKNWLVYDVGKNENSFFVQCAICRTTKEVKESDKKKDLLKDSDIFSTRL